MRKKLPAGALYVSFVTGSPSSVTAPEEINLIIRERLNVTSAGTTDANALSRRGAGFSPKVNSTI